MVRLIKTLLVSTGIFCFCFTTQPVYGKTRVITNVKVIHAATGPKHVGPGLRGIISELEPVFKYTSYRLLKNKRLNQGFKQKGRVDLPGKRTLVVMPSNMDGKRIRYQINILKRNQSIFKTHVLLKNNSSITIGGPQFDRGTLLFNITGSAR